MPACFKFDVVISLGPDCLPAMQTFHYFGRRRRPTTAFSYQTTPPSAVIAYLRHDFRGMMELPDLRLENDAIVSNVRHGTRHPHEFKNGLSSYAEAKSRHDYLTDRMRRIFSSRERILFVTRNAREATLRGLSGALKTYNPALPFRILNVACDAPMSVWEKSLPHWQAALAEADAGESRTFGGLLRDQSQRFVRHLREKTF